MTPTPRADHAVTEEMTKAGWAVLAEWDTSEDCESDHAAMAAAYTAMLAAAPKPAMAGSKEVREAALSAANALRDQANYRMVQSFDGEGSTHRAAHRQLIEVAERLEVALTAEGRDDVLREALGRYIEFNAYLANDPRAIRLEFADEEDRLAAANAIDAACAKEGQ